MESALGLVVEFEPPGVSSFREERTITGLDRHRRLAYSVTVIPSDDQPSFSTGVTISFDDFAGAWPDVLALLEERLK